MINFKSLFFLSTLTISSLIYSQSGYSYTSQGVYSQGFDSYSMYDRPDQPYQSQVYQNGYEQEKYDNKLERQIPDQVITNHVIQNLKNTPYLSPSARDIEVETKDGKVKLKGKVLNKNEEYQIEYMVKNIRGVKSVSTNLEAEKKQD